MIYFHLINIRIGRGNEKFESHLEDKEDKQAGAELGQAQYKIG